MYLLVKHQMYKNTLDSTEIDGLSPYVPYDIYCVTESEILERRSLYDVYTYGLKTEACHSDDAKQFDYS